ncbi:MAG: DUF4199 domain-containing protein [Flavobacteriales bacterium]|nr:DUF4199 domain-containing protein [Flavobacteriales bacterium]
MILQKSIRWGLILGLISIVPEIIIYVANADMVMEGTIKLINFVLTITLWVIFALNVRKENSNSFTFSEAFTSLIVIIGITSLLTTAWEFTLSAGIDPAYGERKLEMSVMGMEKWGMEPTSDQIEEMRESFTPSGVLFGGVWKLLFWAIVSLLFAVIIKRNQAFAKLDTV